LPQSQKAASWAVDEPRLVGGWLVYLHFIGLTPPVPWEIVALNLQSHRQKILVRSQGIALDIPPWINADGDTVIWTTIVPSGAGVASRIETYDVQTGHQSVATESSPYARNTWNAHTFRFYNAAISGPIVAFLKESSSGNDVWIEDLRTGHRKAVAAGGRENLPVVTGPWVAWSDAPKGSPLGPLKLLDLRTGKVQIIDKGQIAVLSAGNGYLSWSDYQTGQFTLLNLVTGLRTVAPKLYPRQLSSTSIRIQGNVLLEAAVRNTTPSGAAKNNMFVSQVVVLGNQHLPAAPIF